MAEDKSLPEKVADSASAALANASNTVAGLTNNASDLVASANDAAAKLASQAQDTKDKLTERARDAKGKFVDRVADGKTTLSDTTSKLADQVSDTRDKLADTTSRLADRVNETGGTLQGQAQTGLRIVRENPLGLVLSGLAVGFLIGVLAPVTDVEREKIAPLRDELVERAQRAAGDVMQHGRGILEETAAAATASATKHGQALAEDLQNDLGTTKKADGSDSAEAPPSTETAG